MFHVKQCGARLRSCGRALLLSAVLAAPAAAQEEGAAGTVTVTAPGLALTGRVLGFDGTYLRLDTPQGELTLDYANVDCDGAACPDPAGFRPELRLSGEAALAGVLLPALVEGFAAARGWRAEPGRDESLDYVLRDADGAETLRVLLRPTTTEDGIADLVAGEADLALLGRLPLPEEEALLADAGLGEKDELRFRLLARGALVAATGPGQRVQRITLLDLARAFSGEVASWADLGGEEAPLRLHLGRADSALAQAFVAEVLTATGRDLAPGVTRHPDDAALAEAVAADPFALGILPSESFGEAQPLALRGRCGLPWVPRASAIRAGDYPLTVPLVLLQPMRRLAPPAQDFVGWLAGPEAQLTLRRAGLVGAEAVPIPWSEQGERLAAAIRAAGPEVPLRELQRMIRVLGPFTRHSPTFRFASGTGLDPLSQAQVLRLASDIAAGRYAGRTLLLAGFSDGRGPAADNRALSLNRAEAVEAALLEALGGALPEGVHLRRAAFGEALPLGCDAEVEGPWGAEVNRRVELWVSG